MKATITNSTGDVLTLGMRHAELPDGSSITFDCLGIDDMGALATLNNTANVGVYLETEEVEEVPCVVVSDSVDPVTGDEVEISLKLADANGVTVHTQVRMRMGIYDDDEGISPTAGAQLVNATKGAIQSGEGTSIAKIRTNGNGKFQCTLQYTGTGTVYVLCTAITQSPIFSTEAEPITFL